MPNWCSNYLEISHSDPEMIKRVESSFIEGRLLDEFIPCPQDLIDTVSGFLGDGDEQKALEQKEAANLERYGYKNWYDHNINEWGTKWDVGNDVIEIDGDTATLAFDSAWSPPINAYDKLLDLGFTIKAMYYEPGMCYAGIYEDGHATDYDFTNLNSEQVASTLPIELNEMFNISDSVAEYEDEDGEGEE